ncbi:ABC transporter permease [Paenibacillaceae bacterium]|nr:ABC transporter permease [Paenibacillaceae bacterium]
MIRNTRNTNSQGQVRRGLGRVSRMLRRFAANKEVLVSSAAIAVIAAVTLLPFLFATHEPDYIDVANRFQKPGGEHWLGTDNFGRDIYSRVIYGIQTSAIVGVIVALASSVLGLIIGLYAAYYRVLDQLFMRISDGLIAFPGILLALAIMATLGPSIRNLVICLTVVITPNIARLVRSNVLVIREQTYIEAMKALGATDTRIIWGHIAVNTLPVLIVQGSFIFVEVMITEAALSFLGAGIPAPTPSLGSMLLDGKMFIFNSWWMTVFPGIALMIVALAFNLLGDGLRDLLDPHTNETRGSAQ